ncbi:hypothetical protein CN065_14230 [Sinorhizobium meliloti]|uniref:hypothetical protein n=1 Tax=Rhizobium meliloti TaxID=382 RepID=UPI000FD7A64B|nr:hypothetical protein [Sinorhizobium meliloti]MQV66159.1 hypothetical protein [Sinorhizobium meliloti]RVQ39350.1 hypothetical protein CN065_14230 [Sinorhizobium meliloti]
MRSVAVHGSSPQVAEASAPVSTAFPQHLVGRAAAFAAVVFEPLGKVFDVAEARSERLDVGCLLGYVVVSWC